MSGGPRIVFFGSSLISAYDNPIALYYRGIVRALHERGHSITFYEPVAFDRQLHRDLSDPPWVRVVVFPTLSEKDLYPLYTDAHDADILIKASGVGVFDELLEDAVLNLKRLGNLVIYWDVDPQSTLERLRKNPIDPFIEKIRRFDMVLTCGGSESICRIYRGYGARICMPIHYALDPFIPQIPQIDARFNHDLALFSNRDSCQERRINEFFFKPAAKLPTRRFLLAGSGWGKKQMPANVDYLSHLYSRDYNAFFCTPRCVLCPPQDILSQYGWWPNQQLFEIAGVGACAIGDFHDGIEAFLEPDHEILVAKDNQKVAEHIVNISTERSRQIGAAARLRILDQHTYLHRAAQVERLFGVTAVVRDKVTS